MLQPTCKVGIGDTDWPLGVTVYGRSVTHKIAAQHLCRCIPTRMHDNSHLAAQPHTVKRQVTREGAYQEGFGVRAGCGEVCLQVLPEVGTGVLADGLPLTCRPESCVPAHTKSMSPTTIFHCKDCKYHKDPGKPHATHGHASYRTLYQFILTLISAHLLYKPDARLQWQFAGSAGF